jgi:hypothetical protein
LKARRWLAGSLDMIHHLYHIMWLDGMQEVFIPSGHMSFSESDSDPFSEE